MKTKLVLPVIIGIIFIGSLQLSGCAGKDLKSNESAVMCEFSPPNTEMLVVSDKSVMCAPPPSEQSYSNKAKIILPIDDEKIKTVTKEIKTLSKIIKTASVSMQVKNIKDSRKVILEIIKNCDAYVSSENQANNASNIEDDMVIRIKPDGFDDIIDKFLEQSIYTDYRKITAQDVTAYYIDTESRLKSKKEVETRYTEILKKATTVANILEVEEKLGVIREEIEATEGKLKYLNDQVTYSTIKLHFYEKLDEVSAPNIGFFYKTGRAFKDGWEGVQLFFIGIICMWPLWLVIIFLILLIVRLIKMWRRKRRKIAESK